MSMSVMVVIQLLVVSFVIGSIALFTTLGNNLGRASLQNIDDIHASAYGSELLAISDYDRPLPSASVYVVLEKNRGNIGSISGSVDDITINSIDDLSRLYNRKVKCIVTEQDNKFIVVIEEG